MLWAESTDLQCKACCNLLVMATVVCTDTVVKRAPFSATLQHFYLKLSTKFEKGDNIKYTFMSNDHSKLHKIRANCINSYFHTHSGFRFIQL